MLDHDSLLNDLHAVLVHKHIQPGDDAIGTVNRLLRKHPRVNGALQLAPDRVQISDETWSLQRLVDILHEVTDHQPDEYGGPIVVVRGGQNEFVVDGRRRINHWLRQKQQGPFRVLVVSEKA